MKGRLFARLLPNFEELFLDFTADYVFTTTNENVSASKTLWTQEGSSDRQFILPAETIQSVLSLKGSRADMIPYPILLFVR
ncbi:hypothetical protein J6590_018626 [Homalodisca vitripennis]|nr:hypothetical protein J6590_018626 [Homalodisca vitripennis]